MFGAILKATDSSFQKGMTFCRSIYVKKVMKLLVFKFEQPSHQAKNNQPGYEISNNVDSISEDRSIFEIPFQKLV